MSVRLCIAWAGVCAAAVASAARAGEHYFDSDGVRIAYVDEGRGETLVLLHGFSVSAAEMWMRAPFAPQPIIPILAKEYRIIAPDLRGHGGSDKLSDPTRYGCEMAEDVIRLLDHLEASKAHVVGYSMGATVAGKLLTNYPQRLLSVTFGGGGPLVRPPRAVLEMMNATATSLERGEGLGPLVMTLTPRGQPKLSRFHAAMISKVMLRGKDQRALAAVMRSQARLEVTEAELVASQVPALFVYGGREAPWKIDLITGAVQALPDAKVVVINGRDHLSTIASPRFWTTVLQFASAHPQLAMDESADESCCGGSQRRTSSSAP
jgi:pimeloyl-ACP methyl ester carboxylesterase